MHLIDRDGRLTPVLKILTDYPRDDLAHDEVHQSLVTACATRGIKPANVDVGAIPGMDTIVAGFKTAQLVFNSKLGYGHIFHTNCAPRKNIVSIKSQGEKIVLGMTRTGVVALMVNAGYSIAPFYEAVHAGEMMFFQTSVPDSGSQFRSRDYFPDAMADLAVHLSSRLATLGADKVEAALKAHKFADLLAGFPFIGAPLDITSFPHLPEATVFYVDSFGNIKLNYKHQKLLAHYPVGTQLVLAIGNTVCDATVGDVGFSMGEGVIALTAGSSGWSVGRGDKAMFTEIFLRGGAAVNQFPGLATGDQVLALRRDDLSKVISQLHAAGREVSEKLDLYNISEARILRLLGRAKLIRDGFDATELHAVLKNGELVKRLMA
ncbi:MAG: hypothetical protein PW788_06920 [Micavibrio sp.]|nr:hypothetical protein [Micavibrio sp.]